MNSFFETVKPLVAKKPKGEVPKPESWIAKLHYRVN